MNKRGRDGMGGGTGGAAQFVIRNYKSFLIYVYIYIFVENKIGPLPLRKNSPT